MKSYKLAAADDLSYAWCPMALADKYLLYSEKLWKILLSK